MATAMSDLPGDMVVEILSRVSSTDLSALRGTCKTWNALSKNHILGKTDEGSTFQGYMVIDSKLCSMKLDLQGISNNGNLAYRPSIKRARIQDEICDVFYWDGLLLLLCLVNDEGRLVVWNPYLRQIRCIQPMDKLNLEDMYGLGYENNNNNNRNHKILRVLDERCSKLGRFCEIYDFNSNSWRVLDVDPGIYIFESGVSLKGNSYFLAIEEIGVKTFDKYQCILLCFDFTAESFGQSHVLPFGACVQYSEIALSRVRDEQLAVLHQLDDSNVMDLWITTKIEPNAATWSKFLRVEMRPFRFVAESFFIDEEKKLAVVSGFCWGSSRTNYRRVYIIEGHGNIKRVKIGKARESRNELVFSSYAPSLVQLHSKRNIS